MAVEHSEQIEKFALVLSEHILRFFPRVREVQVELAERVWSRIEVGGLPHDRAFTAAVEIRLARSGAMAGVTSVWPALAASAAAGHGHSSIHQLLHDLARAGARSDTRHRGNNVSSK